METLICFSVKRLHILSCIAITLVLTNYAYADTVITNYYLNYNFVGETVSFECYHQLGDYYYDCSHGGNLPNNLSCSLSPIGSGEIEGDKATISGTIQQSALGADALYTLTFTKSVDGQPPFPTYEDNYLFITDDYSDYPGFPGNTNYVAKLVVSTFGSRTNGHLHAAVNWGGMTLPADKDCFIVETSQHSNKTFYLEVVSSNVQVTVVAPSYFTWTGNSLITNITPSIDDDIEISVTLSDTQSGYYTIGAKPLLKPIILVHGIMSAPTEEADIADRDVFCQDLDLVLSNLGYYVRFLCYDAGDTEDDAIKNQIADLKSLIEECYYISGNQKVTLIAHSWGNILCDLCNTFYKYPDNLFGSKVDKYISVGGAHSGSPIANIYNDFNFILCDLGQFLGCADAYKDAPEIGSSYMQYTSASPFTNIIALNGKWGTYTSEYYEYLMRHKFLPRNAPLETLDTMMIGFSDGFIPDYSACSTEFIPDSADRKYVFNDSGKGMSHTPKALMFPNDDEIYNAEFGIKESTAANHGVFIAITNLLEGGSLNDISGSHIASVPTTKGALCREVNIIGPNAKKFKHVYAIINGKEIELCPQDVGKDNDETSRRFNEAIDPNEGGYPETPYKILVDSNGSHDIYSKRFHTDIDYSCVFDFAMNISFTNKWRIPYIDKIEADADLDISISFTETTSTGQFNVIGGKVTVNNTPLILNAN